MKISEGRLLRSSLLRVPVLFWGCTIIWLLCFLLKHQDFCLLRTLCSFDFRINIYQVQNANMRWQSILEAGIRPVLKPCYFLVVTLHEERLTQSGCWRPERGVSLGAHFYQWHLIAATRISHLMHEEASLQQQIKELSLKSCSQIVPTAPSAKAWRAGCTRGLTRDKRLISTQSSNCSTVNFSGQNMKLFSLILDYTFGMLQAQGDLWRQDSESEDFFPFAEISNIGLT